MELKTFRPLITVLLFLLTPVFGNAEPVVRLERNSWPELKTCNACVDIQFDFLKMRFPPKDIDQLIVVNLPYPNLTVTLANDVRSKDQGSIGLGIQEPDKLTTTYKKLGYFDEHGIKNNEDFFDVIGDYSQNKSLLLMRKVMGLDTAIGYIKASKGRMHAYWIRSKHPKSQYIYIVVEGNEDVYQFNGNIDAAVYEKLLSNLELSR